MKKSITNGFENRARTVRARKADWNCASDNDTTCGNYVKNN